MKLFLKLVLVAAAVCLLLVIGWCVVLASAFGAFDKRYSRQDLIDHYQSKGTEIKRLTTYYNSIVPAGKIVDVEFEDGSISMVSVEWEEGISKNYTKLWKITNGTRAIDSLVHTLGWKQKTLNQLEDKLDDADCISIKNGVPSKIGFQRSGLGMYFFNVFDQPMSDSLKQQYDRGCVYSIYSDKLVLQYGGGAVGPQCFPKN